MKKFLMFISILIFTVTLAACGDDDEVTQSPSDDATQDQNDAVIEEDTGDDSTPGDATEDVDRTEDDGSADLNTEYMFRSFDLEIDIEGQDDIIDVDYENDKDDNETEASYKHKEQDIDLHGNEAMNALDGIFTGFQFDENTPNDEVIDEVLEAFGITEDPTKFELDIDFANGTEKEYNR